jgi:hypothetical protein
MVKSSFPFRYRSGIGGGCEGLQMCDSHAGEDEYGEGKPAVVRTNHERLPPHCKYRVMIVDDVTRPEYGILCINLAILSHIVLVKFVELREKYLITIAFPCKAIILNRVT